MRSSKSVILQLQLHGSDAARSTAAHSLSDLTQHVTHSSTVSVEETAAFFVPDSCFLSFSESVCVTKRRQTEAQPAVRVILIPAVSSWRRTANYSFTPLHHSFVIFPSFIMTCLASEGII